MELHRINKKMTSPNPELLITFVHLLVGSSPLVAPAESEELLFCLLVNDTKQQNQRGITYNNNSYSLSHCQMEIWCWQALVILNVQVKLLGMIFHYKMFKSIQVFFTNETITFLHNSSSLQYTALYTVVQVTYLCVGVHSLYLLSGLQILAFSLAQSHLDSAHPKDQQANSVNLAK